MATAWRVDNLLPESTAGAGANAVRGGALLKPGDTKTGASTIANRQAQQFGEWSFGKARPVPQGRGGYKALPSQRPLDFNHNNINGEAPNSLWTPVFTDPTRTGMGKISSNNDTNYMNDTMSTKDETKSTTSSKLFQRVKPLDFSHSKFSPRQNFGKSQNIDTSSLSSAHTDPITSAKYDLTEGMADRTPHYTRKQVNFLQNNNNNQNNFKTSNNNINNEFSFEPRRQSPIAGRRAAVLQLNTAATGTANDTEASNHLMVPESTLKRTLFSPKGPRRLVVDPKGSDIRGSNVFHHNNVDDFTRLQNSNKVVNNNNVKSGAVTDWNLTKYDITPGFAPRNTNAQVIAKVSDPTTNPYSAHYLDFVPSALQRSNTFDYSDSARKSRHEPPWKSKLINAGPESIASSEQKSTSTVKTVPYNKPVRVSNMSELMSNKNGIGDGPPKASPVIGRRNNLSHWNESYVDTCSINTSKSDSQALYKHSGYMSKLDFKGSVVNEPKGPSQYNVFQKDLSIFDPATNTNNINQQKSLTNKTTDPKEFDYDDNLYTIAERSRENSRPTSENDSDTNSLDYVTSASAINGANALQFSVDLTKGEASFPGKDQNPKKSILKKNHGLATAQYDLSKMFAASSKMNSAKPVTQTSMADEEMSLQSLLTNGRKVKFNV